MLKHNLGVRSVDCAAIVSFDFFGSRTSSLTRKGQLRAGWRLRVGFLRVEGADLYLAHVRRRRRRRWDQGWSLGRRKGRLFPGGHMTWCSQRESQWWSSCGEDSPPCRPEKPPVKGRWVTRFGSAGDWPAGVGCVGERERWRRERPRRESIWSASLWRWSEILDMRSLYKGWVR